MTFMQDLDLIEIVGWTLLHSLWQGAAIAAGLFSVLRLMKKTTANARYLTACLALCLLAGLPAATFLRLTASESNAGGNSNFAIDDNEKFIGGKSFPLSPANPIEVNNSSGITGQKAENGAALFKFDLVRLEKQAATILPFLVWLWFFGVAWRASRLSYDWRRLRKMQSQADAPVFGEWRGRFVRLCDELKIRRAVEFIESATADDAFTFGWLKPVVVVPASAFLQLAPHELEAIIKHELAHVRRHDYLVNLAQSLIETVFFYHPATWWISATIRREREFACDDAVVRLSDDKIVYARALANLEQIRLAASDETARLRLAAGGKNLLSRIKRIVESNDHRRPSLLSAPAAGLSLLLIAALLINVSSTSFQSFADAGDKMRRKKIAVGFVSIPPVDRSDAPPNESRATAQLLIEKLKAHGVPAIGFVLGGAISDGEKFYPARANIVRLWRDAGFEIGIGNFRHVWFYDTAFEEYAAGVEKNERVVKQILAEKNLPLRYFSYPYLNTGKTAEDKTRFENWLAERNLTPVKYTLDNQEWMYSYAYDVSLKEDDAPKSEEIRAQFLDYMTKMFDHFEAYSQEMFGRDINQTMVLTPSRLVADSADELFGIIEQRGYEFVSMDEAQADEAYRTEENFVNTREKIGKSGISWFERWQMAQGKKLRDEPRVSRLVRDEWNKAQNKK